MVQDIRSGVITLVDGGTARANVVYVDNVVEAIILCLLHPASSGHAFIINNDEPVTWKQFCEAFAAGMPGAPPPRSAALADIQRAWAAEHPGILAESARSTARLLRLGAARAYHDVPLVRTLAGPAAPFLRRYLTARGAGRRPPSPAEQPVALPDRWRAQGLAADVWFSSEKIKAGLGYRQRTSFTEGMALTRSWLEWARIT